MCVTWHKKHPEDPYNCEAVAGYREKPREPQVLFVNKYPWCLSPGYYDSVEMARVAAQPGCLGQVKFIERL